MSGGFKRSSRFGLIGVFVVMAVVAVIGLTMGSGEANPKLALGLIFGVVAVFVVVLLTLQRADLERAAGGDAAKGARAAAEAGAPVEDPTKLGEEELWAAMAVGPIDADAIKARSEMWDVGRRGIKLGGVIFLLIFLTVPSIYLFESFVPLLIGGPLIAIAAVYGAYRAIGPGGDVDSGFDRLDRAMRPLGLQVTERPSGGFEPRAPTMPGFDYRLRGATVLSGERHGRRATVSFGGHEEAGVSQVTVASPGLKWSARSREGSIKPSENAPDAIVSTLRQLQNSTRWSNLQLEAGPEGVTITRKTAGRGDWLCDLWLAERLAGH
ncbi:MAG TPA: hypothetical protein VFI17_02550 [Solirubrobacterales bacterium]|nr:hypothetical protein [Solirubrobacterales bacterium]